MITVGIRELRQQASALIRRVEAGETIEITDRGRPVAILSPQPSPSGLDRLEAVGDLVPAREGLDTLAPPATLPPGEESPARILERLRRDER